MPEHRRPAETDVLIAGGGVAALETVLALHARLGASRRITLLAPHTTFGYRPLTAYGGLVPGPRAPVDLRAFAAEHDATFVHDQLSAVHPDRCEAVTANGLRIAYQALVVAIGAVATNPFPGAVTLGLPHEEPAFEAFVQRVREGVLERVVVVVPPQLAWTLPAYETALLLRHASPSSSMRITVTTPEVAPMERFGPEIAEAILDRLRDRQVELCPETFPVRVADGELWLRTRGLVAVDAAVVLARPGGPIVSGLPIDPVGFIPIDDAGRVVGTTGIWAAGDAAARATKQGGFALQQAEAASSDIVATLTGSRSDVPVPPLVMRAALLDGDRVLYLRAEQHEEGWRGVASWDPLWEPPGKVAGGRLTDYLATREAAAD